ncbi:hypothetical protein BACCIP111895_00047 [Neobacillus rhizosphaerae]|uniref:DUF2802 domain-containing protein n=1 Tax=Neobacillus rhizosphaerae TaxID=2880965 RepID=A0ABN8KHI9_9BACI|nr:hypothetical protein [Neobacillus rhizosphaerae]CAH2712914.1 hypothetical protein BACCIP111895_00047 [Neobacillus rhizosphaerae]
MQTYVNEILLGLNLIGVIYLIVQGSLRRKIAPKEELYQKMNDNQKQLTREISELKMTLKHYQQTLKQESEQWRIERQTLEASIKATRKTMSGQDLLLNDRYKEIFDLQDQGLSVDQIAKKLEKGSGEVAFILQLAAQQRS